jgi:hypothetical protein
MPTGLQHIHADRIAGDTPASEGGCAIVAASAPRLYGSRVIRMDAVNPEGASQT